MVIPYLLLFCWLLPRMGFVKKTGLPRGALAWLFLLKAAAGFVLGWASLRYSTSDYWQQNDWGWQEYQLLLRNPQEYFTNLFSSGYADRYGGLLDSTNSYWNDLKTNLVIKFISICSFFSQGNYYINSIFFNVIAFLGQVALFRVFIQLYPGRRWPVLIGCFLLPSLLLFSSGVHKDAIVFACIGLMCLAMHRWHIAGRLGLRKAGVLLLSLALLFLLRNLVFLAVLPALAAYIMVIIAHWKPWRVFAGIYLLGLVLFFSARHLSPSLDLPARIAEKQGFFLLATEATTRIPLDTLRPTAVGFLQNAPQALGHVFLRPHLAEQSSVFLLPIAAELLAYQLLLLLFIVWGRWRRPDAPGQAFLLFGVLFALANLLCIGYIVNNLGAIVRYRSLFLPLLITPLLAGIDWKRVAGTFKLKKLICL
jgi:hypothetical protein